MRTPKSLWDFSKVICLLLFSCHSLANGNDQNNIKIEPPFWWAGFENSHLQLMVHGREISKYRVSLNNKDIKLKSIEKVDNPNYLFINLDLSKAKPDNIEIQFASPSETFIYSYQIRKRGELSKNREGFNDKDVIYLITPDRFANGDVKNDSIDAYRDKLQRDFEGGRHGGDIQGIINHLDYIEEMGFTQVWLNPVLENAQEKYSYHGYSTTDYYRVDPRMGNNQLYVELSNKARQKKIGLIKDIVLNHIGSGHWWMKDLPTKDWINFAGQFSATNHKRESLHDPYAVEEDKKQFADGWFVPTMPDLNQKNLFVKNYLIQNSIWWIEFANLSGLRIDTYPYSDKAFLSEYTKSIMKEYPNFSIVGEEWSVNPAVVAYWQRGSKRHDDYESELSSVMDFPLQTALVQGLAQKDSWQDGWHRVYASLATDFLYGEPENIMVFADNHDMSRIYTQLNHDVELTKLALTFILTTRGIPQIFYGTEILMDNKGTDSHGIIRTDFPGGFAGDKQNAFSGEGLSEQQIQFQTDLKKLLNWRKTSKAIRDGSLKHYSPIDDVYVYFRVLDKQVVMVVLNKANSKKTIEPRRYRSILGEAIDKNFSGVNVMNNERAPLSQSFQVSAKSAKILEINLGE